MRRTTPGKYYAANRDRILAYQAKYRAAHREQRRAYDASYGATRREEKRARNAKYRATHREEIQARAAKYRVAHREEQRAYDAEYRAAHLEGKRAYNASYRATHPDMRDRRAYNAQYHAAHRQEIGARNARYQATNRQHLNDYSAKRRARKASVTVEDVSRVLVYERDGGCCHICGKHVTSTKFHLDHLIPIVKGGEHSYRNVAITCPTCNLRKGPGRIASQLRLLG